MSIWPYLPVWPFLLAGAFLTCRKNGRAGLAFALTIIAIQAVRALGLPQQQVVYFGVYSIGSILAFLFADRIAGSFIAAVGVAKFSVLAGMLPLYPDVIIGEALLVLGMLVAWGQGHAGCSGKLSLGDARPAAGGHVAAMVGADSSDAQDMAGMA